MWITLNERRFKMAVNVWLWYQQRNNLRRNRIFRDRTNPLDVYDDIELYDKFRFRRQDILSLTDLIADAVEVTKRNGSLPPVLQVCLALRFFACGSFQNVCGELIGVHQSTACRVIRRVTDALLPMASHWIHLPDQREAQQTKAVCFQKYGFPCVFGAIDGTQIRIQSPGAGMQEEAYVNRKNFHSINVQVVCDFNMLFINLVARHPGSALDDRVLRESLLFDAFESQNKPVQGVLLGDSGYMCRDWLLTPLLNPQSQKEQNYNTRHSQARCIVERAIGMAKRRWNCLRRLRVDPPQACKIITVCFMLCNRARRLALPEMDWDAGEEVDLPQDHVVLEEAQPVPENIPEAERVRVEIGNNSRARLIEEFF